MNVYLEEQKEDLDYRDEPFIDLEFIHQAVLCSENGRDHVLQNSF